MSSVLGFAPGFANSSSSCFCVICANHTSYVVYTENFVSFCDIISVRYESVCSASSEYASCGRESNGSAMIFTLVLVGILLGVVIVCCTRFCMDFLCTNCQVSPLMVPRMIERSDVVREGEPQRGNHGLEIVVVKSPAKAVNVGVVV